MEENSNKKKKSIFKLIMKRVKLSHLIILVVLLAANSYAWFIYVNNVSNKIDVHVRKWKVEFLDGDEIVDYVNVEISNAYPGMTSYSKSVVANNYSDLPATASYKVLEANIMGDEFISEEGKIDAGLTLDGDELTAAQLEAKLINDYPFTFGFNLSQTSLAALTGSTTYTVTLAWPYESGDDETDTYWGVRAYEFNEENPGDPCITLKIKIYITQTSS